MRFCLVLACLTTSIASAAPIFYGVTGSNLLRFDMGAHTVTVVAPLTSGGSPLNVMEDCEFDAAGDLWAMRQGNAGGFPPTIVCQAYKVNTGTGNCIPEGNYGTVIALQSLAFRRSSSTFYSVDQGSGTSPTQGHLVTTDPAAGTITAVSASQHGLAGPFRVDALAFAPDGTLYGMWDANTGVPFNQPNFKLVRFDIMTGLGTYVGTVNFSGQTFPSLRFDSAGTAYTVEAGSGDVYTVNLATGRGTLLFAGGAVAINTRGLALSSACATCSGDINADAHVDGADIGGWVRCALNAGQTGDACSCSANMTTDQFIFRLLNAADTACP